MKHIYFKVVTSGLFTFYASRLVIILFTLYASRQVLYSAFEDRGWSVRAESMGGTFVSLSDDAGGILYNPAGLNNVFKKSVELLYTKPYLGLPMDESLYLTYLSAVIPFEKFSIGMNYNIFDVVGLYRESGIILSAGTMLSKIDDRLPDVCLGVNIKMLMLQYSFDEEILSHQPDLKDKNSKSALSADFGVIYRPLPELSLGLVVKDINSPDIGVIEKNPVPQTVKFAAGYNLPYKKLGDMSVYVEGRYRLQDWGEQIDFGLGAETFFSFYKYAIRFGLNRTSINLGFGYYLSLTDIVGLQINYGISFSTVVLDNFGTHRISLEFKW